MTTKILVVLASLAVIALIIGAVLVFRGDMGPEASQPGTSQSPSPAAETNKEGEAKVTSTDEVVGTGAEAKVGSSISVKYTGKLADGTVFDSTDKHGGEPITFTLAEGSLIAGWVQGIPGMKVGGKRTLVIPPSLAYGERGNDSIPPNATLTFDIELMDVK